MKIQCDVCTKEEASVFCTADEAALCDGCDRGVHHANKLAGKHLRFPLLRPSLKDAPLCDICQERRAFLFCQEDRAILCRECDIPIHKANELTQKHNRFLLTGVKLPASDLSSSSSYNTTSSSSTSSNVAPDSHEIKSLVSNDHHFLNPNSNDDQKALPLSTSASTNCDINDHPCISQEGSISISTSSISEYLIETLPGWHVEDFLDPSSCSPHGFCKMDYDDLETNLYTFSSSSEGLAIWVPQAPPQSSCFPLRLPQTSMTSGLKGSEKAKRVSMTWNEDGFTVP